MYVFILLTKHSLDKSKVTYILGNTQEPASQLPSKQKNLDTDPTPNDFFFSECAAPSNAWNETDTISKMFPLDELF